MTDAEDDLEVVFETRNAAEAAIVTSLLESAGIPYLTRGEDRFDAFPGAFRDTVFGGGGRPIVVLVNAADAPPARELIDGNPLTD